MSSKIGKIDNIIEGEKMRTYKEILDDIANSCDKVFYGGHKGREEAVIEAATKIYIAEWLSEYSQNTKQIDDCIKYPFKETFANKMCQSESDHEWECWGIGTDGTTYICKKCHARRKYPIEYHETTVTI